MLDLKILLLTAPPSSSVTAFRTRTAQPCTNSGPGRNARGSLVGAEDSGVIEAARTVYRKLPAGFQRRVLVARRTPLWLKAGIVFIHIPKAAGTAINEALYGQFMGHVRAADIERWALRPSKPYPASQLRGIRGTAWSPLIVS